MFCRERRIILFRHNKSLDPDFVQEFRKSYKKNEADAKKLVSGFLTTYNKKSVLEVSKKRAEEEYDEGGAGGLAFLAAFSDITHNLDANKTATKYIEDKIDEIVKNKNI